MITINIKIKEIREKGNVSLEQLEDATGISRERISEIENNKLKIEDILFVEMVLIAEALAFSILDLYEVTSVELQ